MWFFRDLCCPNISLQWGHFFVLFAMGGQRGLHEGGRDTVSPPKGRVYILIPRTHSPRGSAAESYNPIPRLASTHSMLVRALLEVD